jgi:hypothetical protein
MRGPRSFCAWDPLEGSGGFVRRRPPHFLGQQKRQSTPPLCHMSVRGTVDIQTGSHLDLPTRQCGCFAPLSVSPSLLSHPSPKKTCLNPCYHGKLVNEGFHPPDCPSCIWSRHLGSSTPSRESELPEPRGILVSQARGRHSSWDAPQATCRYPQDPAYLERGSTDSFQNTHRKTYAVPERIHNASRSNSCEQSTRSLTVRM